MLAPGARCRCTDRTDAGRSRPSARADRSDRMFSVPLPWCTSKSTMATRSRPCTLERMPRRDGHVVEEAEAHRLLAAGVVAGRAHRAEGVLESPAITASVAAMAAPAARRAASSVKRVSGGVGVDLRVVGAAGGLVGHQALVQRLRGARRARAVRPGDLLPGWPAAPRGVQRIAHAGEQQAVFDGIQPLRGTRDARPMSCFQKSRCVK
jgi:hypothetical protein